MSLHKYHYKYPTPKLCHTPLFTSVIMSASFFWMSWLEAKGRLNCRLSTV